MEHIVMNPAVIEEARRRIDKVRRQNVEFTVLRDGRPVPNVRLSVRMTDHDFLFGAVCYMYGKYADPAMNELFSHEFTNLFNYTMVPFHWNWYEPRRGEFAEPYTGNLISWAERCGLKKKLHALIWHECCPDWVHEDDDIEALYTERISQLMLHYGDRFDFFDVANETTVNDRFENPVSHWVRRAGPMHMLKFGTKLTRSFRPDAKLIYGDWNVHGEEYTRFLQEMRENDIDIDLLGMQSHMHSELWTAEETLRVIDNAAAFGWPIHFPETSICSGSPVGEMQFGAGAINRFTETEEDLYFQADYASDFYTLIFSHPAVEALSWFDFTDHRWLGAPGGCVTDDLRRKPVYDALYRLIHEDWHDDLSGHSDEAGRFSGRLFFGTYEIVAEEEGQAPKRFVRKLHRPSFYTDDGQVRRIGLNLDEK